MVSKRTEPFLATYLHNMGGKKGLPISGNFELTARCNFNCPMCYVHLQQEDIQAIGRELTAGQWIDIARQAKELGMMFVLLTGGEPFVRKDFFEIYHAIKAMGLMVSINSNGSMLRGEILERLLEDPPFRMNISLYGGSNETYYGMCGQNAFHTVVENIRALKNAGVDIRLNVSLTPYNRQDLEKIHAIAQKLNVQMKVASYMYPPVRIDKKFGCGNRLNPQEAAEAMVQWDLLRFTPEGFAQRARNMQHLTCEEINECGADPDEGVSCRAGHSSCWITWDGRMLPCGMMPEPTAYPLETGFSTAWEQIRQLTKQIKWPAECTECSKRKVCASCAAVRMAETGAFDKVPLYACRQTEAMIQTTLKAYEERGMD